MVRHIIGNDQMTNMNGVVRTEEETDFHAGDLRYEYLDIATNRKLEFLFCFIREFSGDIQTLVCFKKFLTNSSASAQATSRS